MPISYPSNQLEDPRCTAGLLGSFWPSLYASRDQVVALSDGRNQLEQQTLYDLRNLRDTGSRLTTPPFRRLRWLPVTIAESAAIPADIFGHADILRYGAPGAIYGKPDIHYGVSNFGSVAFPVLANLANVSAIFSHISNPTVSLTRLIDFDLDTVNHRLVFASNPFNNPHFPVTEIFDENLNVVDREIDLWLFQADVDEEWMADVYGHVVGIHMPSSDGYKSLINGLWDALVGGSAREQLDAALSAMTGAERAASDGEVVEHITNDNAGKLVITDKGVYRFHPDANILVNTGDKLTKGQYLADTYTVHDINHGDVPPEWPALTLGSGFLSPNITGELTFQNEMLPTTYIPDDGYGYSELRFPVNGDSNDVNTFFNEMQSRGRDMNNTLAMALDNRTNPIGQPGPTNVPSMINPMEFVIKQVLRYNALLVTIQGSQFGPNAFGLDLGTKIIRAIMPPWTALISLIKLTGETESVTLALTDESFSNLDAIETQSDSASDTYVNDSLNAAFYVDICKDCD